ncbi:hypothetical protein [Leptospira johnsonii]|uniref:Phage ABA sandwich domain-containing protein n=1 Tax=Leptospira johnsonii TaxID=1917820 RepID=A0A2P2D7Q3_9LEPT|nr:hypothetical protein [Leptospira johnsonii]GBF40662.1 hypothetical protein LPTSP1_36800 [Leptospira johnsonii]
MTQPTQEDLEYVAKEILKWEHCPDYEMDHGSYTEPADVWVVNELGEWIELLPDFYTDDSFTGALVKAVFPLFFERQWCISPLSDGRIWVFEVINDADGQYPEDVLTAPNLNTALIEAWKKIHNPE